MDSQEITFFKMFTDGAEIYREIIAKLSHEEQLLLANYDTAVHELSALRGAAKITIIFSKYQDQTNDEKKSEFLLKCVTEHFSMSKDIAVAILDEVYRQHNNASTFFTDSPEDIGSRVDKIVIKALKGYIEAAQ